MPHAVLTEADDWLTGRHPELRCHKGSDGPERSRGSQPHSERGRRVDHLLVDTMGLITVIPSGGYVCILGRLS